MSRATILLSSARCGTNFFLSIYWNIFRRHWVFREIFRDNGDNLPKLSETTGLDEQAILEWVAHDPLALWRSLERLAAGEGTGLIAKIFYYHACDHDALWAHFHARNRIVHLLRRNLFNCFLSNAVAERTGQWQARGDDIKSLDLEPLVLEAAEIEEFIERRLAEIEQAREYLRGSDHVEIHYEDIAAGAEQCARTICGIYSVPLPTRPVRTGLRKQKRRPNRDMVANYAAVAHLDREFVGR